MPPSSSALASFTVAATDEAWLAYALGSAGGPQLGPVHHSRGGSAITVLSFCPFSIRGKINY